MTDWSQMEHGALSNFVAAPGALKTALEKFISAWALEHKALCTACMASVPRDPERAADYAAKAQVLEEFWTVLADQLTSFARPSQEPTLRGLEGE